MQQKRCRITVAIQDHRLYDAVKLLAAEKGMTLREVVTEALKDWVEKQEDLEDVKAIEEVEHEPSRPIGI